MNLAADVVGDSRLMREDETRTLAQLRTLRNEILEPKTHELIGRIFNASGDRVLIRFSSFVNPARHTLDE